jgi:hypothetical protein
MQQDFDSLPIDIQDEAARTFFDEFGKSFDVVLIMPF